MAMSMIQMALAVSSLGTVSFILGVIAENKKPAAGTPFTGTGVVICKYPSDPTVALGYSSAAALIACTVFGFYSIFHPYQKKSVPLNALFQSTKLVVFLVVALAVSALGTALMLWGTISENFHLVHNVHHNLETGCPTAKTGLFGGAAFVALDAALFWLICLMLTSNARADFFEEEDSEGQYGEVTATDYDAPARGKV